MSPQYAQSAIVLFFLAVGLFFVLRAVVLWYFRVGEIVNTLKSIDARLAAQQPAQTTPAS